MNTRLFAVAAISTCCTDTNAMMNAGGIVFADAERVAGYPPTIARDEAFWGPCPCRFRRSGWTGHC
jgi:hypothetical protein